MSALSGSVDTRTIDSLNIGLIGLSWGLALFIPFPLFLFAYAVLGPLHYLTEISWLHERDYFIRERRGVLLFVIASLIITTLVLSGRFFPSLLPTLVYLLFGSAFALSIIKEPRVRFFALMALFVTAVVFAVLQPPVYALVFMFLIPTVVHVFFFTATFMLSGALKSGSRSGFLAFGVLLLAGGSLFFIVPDKGVPLPGSYIFESYQPFVMVNTGLMELLSFGSAVSPTTEAVFSSRTGLAVMQFLAFSYTYHYANWFSKVRVIGWNGMPALRRKVIMGSWLSALAVYLYDYRIGVQILLFLSFLHVLLEFPLNHRSFADIGRRLLLPFRTRLSES